MFRFEKVVSSLAETPKSASLALPSFVSSTFPALISYGITLSIQRYAVNLLVVVQVGDSKQDGRHDVLDLLLAEHVGLLVLQVGERAAVSELHHNLRMNLLTRIDPEVAVFVVAAVVTDDEVALTLL